MNKSELKEAKEYLTNDIAPKLMPNVRGMFQARLVGLYRNHAEIEINLVDSSKNIVKRFGSNVVPQGGAVIVDKFSSIWNIGQNLPSIDAYFQAWLIGISQDHKQAEISLRLVDENRNELKNFGSATVCAGKSLTLEGLEITVNILPKDMH